MRSPILFGLFLFLTVSSEGQEKLHTDILVIGGGVGGTAAGIQSARCGANTVIIEATPWLGGMMSAAGVTATDGNNKLYSGMWQEFREALYTHYQTRNLATGWVSNTLFEPHVADSIFKALAAKEKKLMVKYNYQFFKTIHDKKTIEGAIFKNNTGASLTVYAKVIIDATELGDALASAGVPYDLGMEADSITHENAGVLKNSAIIQDLTYAAILKDYGKGTDHTIPQPKDYTPEEFDGSCIEYYHNEKIEKPSVSAIKMLDYGKLPNHKYMLNWPRRGNDTYLNVVEMKPEKRATELNKAKQTTLRFIYFIQHELGFPFIGIADDEYNTEDHLPYIPYYREGRRVHGLVRFTYKNIAAPFTYGDPLYRTGISVGDYPIDHHHKKNEEAPQHLSFYPIPSFNVPIGALIPSGFQNFIIAEKGISVSNIVNGTTRLQPCVLLTGQAAGVLAAISVKQHKQPEDVDIRSIQQELLNRKAYIMPYIDNSPSSPYFSAIQKTGATGILKGTGKSFAWANQTWFYPDSLCKGQDLMEGLNEFCKGYLQHPLSTKESYVTAKTLSQIIAEIKRSPLYHEVQNEDEILDKMKKNWGTWELNHFSANRELTRAEVCVVTNQLLAPFSKRSIDFKGHYK